MSQVTHALGQLCFWQLFVYELLIRLKLATFGNLYCIVPSNSCLSSLIFAVSRSALGGCASDISVAVAPYFETA